MASIENKSKTYYMVGIISITLGTLLHFRKKEEVEKKCELTYVASLVNLLNANSGGKSWLNLGYWTEETSSYGQAAEKLALKVVERRKPPPRNEEDEPLFIDVGCGLGESLNLWIERFNADEKSFGINLNKAEVDIAQLRGGNMVSRVFVGNACAIPANSSCADVVVAVDSAYHFITRSKFISEASRVLKPGGFFGAADVITVIDNKHAFLLSKLLLKLKRQFIGLLVGLPFENMYDEHEYTHIMKSNGFTNIEIQDVTQYVPDGFERWGRKEMGRSWVVGAVASFVAHSFRFAELKFVIVSANKSSMK